MKTNKEVIHALTEYFLTQDSRAVARACAATMIDVQRMWEFQELPLEEKKCLLHRVQANVDALRKFASSGPDGELVLTNLESAP